MSEHILTNVNKDFDNTLVKIKADINNDANTIKQNIKQELYNVDKLGRKIVIDEIAKARNDFWEEIKENLGLDEFEGVTLKDAIVEEFKNEINGSIKRDIFDEVTRMNYEVKDDVKKAVEHLGGEIDHLDGIVDNKNEAAGQQIKDEITGMKEDDLKDAIIEEVKKELGTDEIKQKLENCEKSISSLKTDMENEYLESEIKSLKDKSLTISWNNWEKVVNKSWSSHRYVFMNKSLTISWKNWEKVGN